MRTAAPQLRQTSHRALTFSTALLAGESFTWSAGFHASVRGPLGFHRRHPSSVSLAAVRRYKRHAFPGGRQAGSGALSPLARASTSVPKQVGESACFCGPRVTGSPDERTRSLARQVRIRRQRTHDRAQDLGRVARCGGSRGRNVARHELVQGPCLAVRQDFAEPCHRLVFA